MGAVKRDSEREECIYVLWVSNDREREKKMEEQQGGRCVEGEMLRQKEKNPGS